MFTHNKVSIISSELVFESILNPNIIWRPCQSGLPRASEFDTLGLIWLVINKLSHKMKNSKGQYSDLPCSLAQYLRCGTEKVKDGHHAE